MKTAQPKPNSFFRANEHIHTIANLHSMWMPAVVYIWRILYSTEAKSFKRCPLPPPPLNCMPGECRPVTKALSWRKSSRAAWSAAEETVCGSLIRGGGFRLFWMAWQDNVERKWWSGWLVQWHGSAKELGHRITCSKNLCEMQTVARASSSVDNDFDYGRGARTVLVWWNYT